MNEYLATDVTLLSFVTVGDYARDDHQFQEQARHQDDPNHAPRPYRGNIHRCWARMTINDAFHYADICSLEGYLVNILEEHGFDRIADLIPHKYIDGPNHGRRADKGFVYDKRIEAARTTRIWISFSLIKPLWIVYGSGTSSTIAGALQATMQY